MCCRAWTSRYARAPSPASSGPTGRVSPRSSRRSAACCAHASARSRWPASRSTSCAPDEVLRRGVSQVPQAHALFPNLTVRENVLLGGYLIRRDRRLVRSRYEAGGHAVPDRRRPGGRQGRQPLRRPAPHGRVRPLPHARPDPAAARRAVTWPRPEGAARGLRLRAAHARDRQDHPDRRAERPLRHEARHRRHRHGKRPRPHPTPCRVHPRRPGAGPDVLRRHRPKAPSLST